MTDALRTLFSARGDPSPDSRAEKTDAAIGSGFCYTDPNTPERVTGREAHLACIAQFGAAMPGASAQVIALSRHHGHARAAVDFLKDGALVMRGQYFADIADGGIARLIGFPGMGEPE